MTYFISIIHIITACLIVLLVLMQDSKGGGFGLGGGSSNTLFGTSGASNFLVKTTRWLALIFAITSLSLTSLTNRDQESVLDEYEVKTNKAPSSTSSQKSPLLDQNKTKPLDQPTKKPDFVAKKKPEKKTLEIKKDEKLKIKSEKN